MTSPPRARPGRILAITRLTVGTLLTTAMYVAYLARRLFAVSEQRRPIAVAWSHVWALLILKLMGISLSVVGSPPPGGTLITPNHTSYLDVFAIFSAVPCFFVSKAEAAGWPAIGALIRASEQILVSRRRSRDLKTTAAQIEERLRAGQSVCIFLEGTTTGGDRILPFHGSLLSSAIDVGTRIVPVGVRWSASPESGVSVSEDVAYWKDHQFVPHLWRVLGLSGVCVEIRFGSLVEAAGEDRKVLAASLRDSVLELWRSTPGQA